MVQKRDEWQTFCGHSKSNEPLGSLKLGDQFLDWLTAHQLFKDDLKYEVRWKNKIGYSGR
jgi:hypothetical protein